MIDSGRWLGMNPIRKHGTKPGRMPGGKPGKMPGRLKWNNPGRILMIKFTKKHGKNVG